MVTVTVHPSFCCGHNKGLRGPINTARVDRAVAPSWLMWAKQSGEKLLLVQRWATAEAGCKIRSKAENRSITGIRTLWRINLSLLLKVTTLQYTEILFLTLNKKKNHVHLFEMLNSGLLHWDLRPVRNMKCTSLFYEDITCTHWKIRLLFFLPTSTANCCSPPMLMGPSSEA